MTFSLAKAGFLTGDLMDALAVAPDGTVVGAHPRRASVWRHGQLAHSVSLPGFEGGPVAIGRDGESARIGDRVVDLTSGSVTSSRVDTDLLTLGLDPSQLLASRFYGKRASAPSADGRRLVATFVHVKSRGKSDDEPNLGPAGQVVLVDPDDGSFIAVLEDIVRQPTQRVLAINDDHVVVGGEAVRSYSAHDGALVAETVVDAECTAVCFSADGTYAAAALDNGTITIIAVGRSHPSITWNAHRGAATAVAFHPLLPMLATAGHDDTLKLWTFDGHSADLASSESTAGVARAFAFDGGGVHLYAAIGGGVIIYDVGDAG